MASTVIGDGRKTVTTAGTAEALVSVEPSIAGVVKSLVITALSTNTGTVVVGGSTVLAAAGTRRGVPLAAGGSVSLDFSGGLTKVFLDVTVSGEGVSYAYIA